MKFSLIAIILQVICGLVCIGLGIFYCFSGTTAQIAIFFIAGAGCFINAVRMYLANKKNK